jgi:protein-disulfide isomerase
MEEKESPSEHKPTPVHHEVHPAPHHEQAHQAPVHHATHESALNPWMLVSVLLAVLLLVSLYMNYSLVQTAMTKPAAAPAAVAPTPSGAQAAPTPPANPIVNIQLKADDHAKGVKTAKVTIVEYSDFQCPYCGRAEPTVEQILTTYGKDVYFVYRHFPLSFHPNARPAALASECAAEQGKFWEFHDLAYANQDKLGAQQYIDWATQLKLDVDKFKTCVDSQKYAQRVDEDFTQGQTDGVTGTPAFFINGQLIAGAYPFDSFKQIIDAKLAAT